jgi:predicted esterase
MLGFVAAVLLQAAAPPAPRVAPGEIADPVPCASNSKLTYALYLPTRFTPERAWPILYIFDPRGRGRLAAELFKDVAERRGFILASSNDTQSDNPKAPNSEAINALWGDTHLRLPIDSKRVYATGFSGGARLACSLGLALNGGLSGVIAVGGGFPPERPPVKGLPFSVFGTVGTRDFNYYEMRDLDVALEKLGLSHRLEVWEGDHDWPPPELASEAVEWMDLIAMKKGTLAREDAVVEAFYTRGIGRAAELEAKGKSAEALVLDEALKSDLAGLRDVAAASASAERLRKAGVGEELKRREKLDRRDASVNNKNTAILETIRSGEDPPPAGRAVNDLDVEALKKLAAQDSYEGRSAERRLAHILVQTSFYLPREMMERGEYRRAITLLQIAAAIRPESPWAHWGLARAFARAGAKRDALAALGRAIDNGLADRARIEADADLAPLRAEPEFATLLERVKPAPAPASNPLR